MEETIWIPLILVVTLAWTLLLGLSTAPVALFASGAVQREVAPTTPPIHQHSAGEPSAPANSLDQLIARER